MIKNVVQVIALSSFWHGLNVNAEHPWQCIRNSLAQQMDHWENLKIILLKRTIV